MQRFLVKTSAFSILLILVLVVLELAVRTIPNDYVFKCEFLDKHSREIETLILGSSHSFYGLNPEHFTSNTFNAGHVSQSLDYDQRLWLKYKDDFVKLKTIYLPISYFSFWLKLDNAEDSWRSKNYTIYYDIPNKRFRHYFEMLSLPFDKNIERILKNMKDANYSERRSSNLGWGENYKSYKSKNLLKSGKAAAVRHTFNTKENEYRTVLQQNLLFLTDLSQWCIKNDVLLVLFTPPAFETYRQNLNNEQLKMTCGYSEKVASEYANTIYLNLLSDKTFDKNDFYDADHLSEIGAKKLSILLNNVVNKIDFGREFN